MAKVIGCPQRIAKQFLDTALRAMTVELVRSGQIKFRDFGTFMVVKRASRLGRNLTDPSKSVRIPARLGVRFTASPKLTKAVRKGR
jgi:nucleoid DNA-binding protein